MNRVGSFVVVGMSLLGLQLSGCGGGGEGDSVTKSAPTIQELAKTDAAIASAAPDCPAEAAESGKTKKRRSGPDRCKPVPL